MPVHQLGTKPPKISDHKWTSEKYKALKSRPNNVSSSHWSIQKHNNQAIYYADKVPESHRIMFDTANGFHSKAKYNNMYHQHAKEGKKYWFKDSREIKNTSAKWFGQTRPLGGQGSFTGLPQF